MKKLLHIIATPRGEASRTLKVSNAFIESFLGTHSDWQVDELNVFTENLPEMTTARLDGKYELMGGRDLSDESKVAWAEIIKQIDRFKSADSYLLSVPMWNFNIPYQLKHYFDVIVQPKYLFHYTDMGPEGLIKDKKMLVITSRGGDYGAGAFVPYDQQVPYLKTILGFIGLSNVTFIHAQPMDSGDFAIQKRRIELAKSDAAEIAKVWV